MQDDHIQIDVSELPKHMQSLLNDRGYASKTISAIDLAREYSGWHLGDECWAIDIISVYNQGVSIAVEKSKPEPLFITDEQGLLRTNSKA
jgi:hypothetical protein